MIRQPITIVGAGLAGATAAALLKDRYAVTVIEKEHKHGGLCADARGWQECGPHAFHTDDEEVWEFVQRLAEWRPFVLRVHAQTDPALRELPYRRDDDPAFRIYSEKAWGLPFAELPASIRARVPGQCEDGRTGYHAGRYKAQPEGGYSAMISRMLHGVAIREFDRRVCGADHPVVLAGDHPVIWTGNLNDATLELTPLRWFGRQWFRGDGRIEADGHIVNHATWTVPQLRSWDNVKINPWHVGRGVGVEFSGGRPCYPHPDDAGEAQRRVSELRARGVWCCGRMGGYQYLDMDATIRNVMDTIKEAGL